MQSRYLEILDFTQFFDHFVFTPNAENVLKKELKREIPVSVGIELVVVDMSRNKAFRVGTITAIEGTSIAVEFDKVGLKKMGYEFCMEKKMLEFI